MQTKQSPQLKSEYIKGQAFELGFCLCGITSSNPLHEDEAFFRQWLENNYHAQMLYMERNIEKRINPEELVEGAKSIIVLAHNYYPAQIQNSQNYKVAKYAYGKDYHTVIKNKLFELTKRINNQFGAVSGRCFVDSAPVLERSLAQRAGLGWLGRNGMLISPQHGSFIFLASIFINHDLEYDAAFEKNHCGTCNRCMQACPTNALIADRCLDARKCISYQTIENKLEIDLEVQLKNKQQAYGCDICQDVCPWNSKSKPHNEPLLNPHPQFITMSDEQWQNMTEADYQLIFSNSAVERAGWKGLSRNIKALNEKNT